MRRLVFLLAACGGGSSPPTKHGGPPAAMIAAPAVGDVVVATVDGRPVFGACVADQIKATPTKSKQVALDECIAFELMAQEAEKRGLDRQWETVDATRTALVTRLVDQFAARTTMEALAPRLDALYKPPMVRPEFRESWHALIKVDRKAPDAELAAARQLAEKIHDALKAESGLTPPHFEEVAKRIAPAADVAHYPLKPSNDQRTARDYLAALFEIPEVGRVSRIAQSDYGFHVILLSDLQPSFTFDREAAHKWFYPNLQRRLFDEFLGEIVAKSGTKAEQYPEVLDALEKDHNK